MAFARTTVEIGGEQFHLRESSAGATEALGEGKSERTQTMTLIALCLTDADGEPLYSPERAEEGLAYVRTLPFRVVAKLDSALGNLMAGTLDDARGN